jgi:hypothetical protein
MVLLKYSNNEACRIDNFTGCTLSLPAPDGNDGRARSMTERHPALPGRTAGSSETCVNICDYTVSKKLKKKLHSVAVVRKRTILTERPPLVGEVSANYTVSHAKKIIFSIRCVYRTPESSLPDRHEYAHWLCLVYKFLVAEALSLGSASIMRP